MIKRYPANGARGICPCGKDVQYVCGTNGSGPGTWFHEDGPPCPSQSTACGHTECGLCRGSQDCQPRKCRFCSRVLCHDCMLDHHHPEITGEPVEVTW